MLDPLVESPQARGRLPRAAVGAVAGRPAAAHRAVGELIPYDDITFYEADEAKRAEGRLRVGSRLGEGAGGRAVLVRRRHHRLGRRAPGAGAREPQGSTRACASSPTPSTPSRSSSSPSWRAAGSRGRSTSTAPGSRSSPRTSSCSRSPATPPRSPWTARIRASLERQAQTDPLTGLWNHRASTSGAIATLVDASADQSPVALVMLDLDDFKRVNDVYSHATGDHVLSEMATILLASVRSGDCVCRIGGEEFAIIAPSSSLSDAFRLAERLQGSRADRVRPGRAGHRLRRDRGRPGARREPARGSSPAPRSR